MLDLVTANLQGGNISIWLGLGDGALAGEMIYGAGNCPGSVALGDFNEDGMLDVAAANSGSNDVSVLLNRTPAPRTVYRFWSPAYSRHFYTIRPAERDKLINNYSHVWTYEGPAYKAWSDDRQSGVAPVYRFWSASLNAHVYTIKPAERDKLLNSYSHVWAYEGVAFYAYAPGAQPTGTMGVYRFWSTTLNCHFYTAKLAERDKLINSFSSVWAYENIMWYAYGA